MKENLSDDDDPLAATSARDGDVRAQSSAESAANARRKQSARKLIASGLVVFAIAFGVRLLTWQETRLEVGKVQTVVTAGYKRDARFLEEGGAASLFSRAAPLANPDSLGHPPGYPLLLAAIFKLCGESDAAIQFFQITCDAMAAVVLFLIVNELLNFQTALLASLFAALSPQLAWNSVLLLPDSLSVLPILCAVYLIARATRQSHTTLQPLTTNHTRTTTSASATNTATATNHTRAMKRTRAVEPTQTTRRSHLAAMFVAGALVGVSCWLRANALLLAPLLGLCVFFTTQRVRRLPLAASLVAGALVIVGVMTLRNAVVFRSFIPVSLGAGQTLLEGIADYDPNARFGVPPTDIEIMRQEADAANRSDYNATLLGADGIARERQRLARGFAVIKSHPAWFASVMLRRAASMLRMERARRVSAADDDAARDSTSHLLMRTARAMTGALQKLFITALVLPLALCGAFILARSRQQGLKGGRRALAVIAVVPVYYLCFQSIVHTEYRYTLAVNYFLFALAAVALSTFIDALTRSLRARASHRHTTATG